MTILENLIVNPALYQEVGGSEAQAGDQVTLYLDQTIAYPDPPPFIVGVIQPTPFRTCAGTSYSVEYDETELAGSGIVLLTPDMVTSVEVVSEAQVLYGQCVHTVPQALTPAEQIQVRENIGVPEIMFPPFVAFPTSVTDGSINFTISSDDFPVNSIGVYEQILNSEYYLGNPIFANTNGTVDLSNGTITGSGYAFICLTGTPSSVPVWTLCYVTEGTYEALFADKLSTWELNGVDHAFIPSPVGVETWIDLNTTLDATATYSEIEEIDLDPAAVGQVALTYIAGQWGFYMCFQNHPTRWTYLSPAIPN